MGQLEFMHLCLRCWASSSLAILLSVFVPPGGWWFFSRAEGRSCCVLLLLVAFYWLADEQDYIFFPWCPDWLCGLCLRVPCLWHGVRARAVHHLQRQLWFLHLDIQPGIFIMPWDRPRLMPYLGLVIAWGDWGVTLSLRPWGMPYWDPETDTLYYIF